MDSETFKKIRKENNLTQLDLSDYLGCSKSMIEKIEGGAPIKSPHIIEVMKSISKFGIASSSEESISKLDQFKIDCSLTYNNLIDLIDMTDEDIKRQQEECDFDYLKELKGYAKQAADDLNAALNLI